MKASVYTIVNPITIERLVEICKAMKSMERADCYRYGKECGLSKHNVDAIRQMLGYTNPERFTHLTAEQREKIADEYIDGGITMNALARKYNINYNSVRCILLNRDVTINTAKNWTRRQELFMLNELKKGKSQKEIAEAKVSAEVELKEYKRRMQAAFNSQQTQLEQQKKHMASLERKSRENSMMNDFYYRVIKEAGIDVDHKGERERIHNEIYREMIMTSTAPKEEEDDC